MQRYAQTNGIQLSYIDYPPQLESEDAPTLVLMHGLSANAHSFDGLITAGLNARTRTILPDLRGRGLSDKPETGYSMAEHAADLVGLLDVLDIQKAVVGGHSFGGLVTMYTAAHYPDRISKMVLLDSGLMPPNVREIIKPSVDRLNHTYESWQAYLETIQNASYFTGGRWHDDMVNYYRADVEDLPDGRVKPRAKPAAIEEAAVRGLEEDWHGLMAQANQPSLLLHAAEPFTPDGPPVLNTEDARQTSQLLTDCTFKIVPGHHLTMLFGRNAQSVVEAIDTFIFED